ncbi:MAG: MFS transporter [Chloroflexota bacterium]
MSNTAVTPTIETYGKWVLIATIFTGSMAFIDVSALHVALPTIQQDLQSTAAQLLWIVNSYALMLASLLLVSGSLGDKLGQKRVFIVGIVIFIVSSVACGLASTSRMLITMRTIQGIGAAVMVPGSLSLIVSHYPSSDQGRAIGIWSAATALVTVSGPLLGGFLADAGLWRYLFYINVPLGAIALAALTQVPEKSNSAENQPIDFIGAILATVGLAGITYGFLSVAELEGGFADPQVWGTLTVGTGSLIGFIFWQMNTDHPMVPLYLFKSRTFSATNFVTFLLYGAMSVFSFFLSLNLVQIQGYEAREAGLAFLPFAFLVVIMSPWAGRMSDRYGPRPMLTVGPILAGLGFLWISFIGLTAGASEMWTTFFPGVLIFGLGISLTVAPLTTAVMTALPSHYAGVASGVNNAVSRTAGVLAIAIMGGIAIIVFEQSLATRILEYSMTADQQKEMLLSASQLAETQVPSSVDDETTAMLSTEIKLAFVDMNRIIMQLCAIFAIASGIIAWVFLESGTTQSQQGRKQQTTTIIH